MKKEVLTISVVIPLLNEAESLVKLEREITDEFKKLTINDFEIIWVDDGSQDGSWQVIEKLVKTNPKNRGIRFRRNYGKAAGLSAGFEASRGKIVVTMDADGQDVPSEMGKLIEKLKDGYDVVSGWKQKRKDSFIKNQSSKLFNATVGLFFGIKLHDFNCGYKAYRREALEDLRLYGEWHRYIPAILYRQGFRVTEVKVEHRARQAGKSKYGWGRFYKGFFDLLTISFLTGYGFRPMHLFGVAGLTSFGLGLAGGAYLTWVKWGLGQSIGQRPLLLLSVLLMIVGVQLVMSGLIAELVTANTDKLSYQIKETAGEV